MKKLALNLDELTVDSFDTVSGARERRGTVAGHDSDETNDAGCWAATAGGRACETTGRQIICGCSAFPTDCDATCPGYHAAEVMSCYETCRVNCGG